MSQSTKSSRPRSQGRQRSLSTEEANRLVGIVRRKSSGASSVKHRNLRMFLGHAHVCETLRHEFVDVEPPIAAVAAIHMQDAKPATVHHIEWADSFADKSAEEDEALNLDDDGEEDLESLSLVRTTSRSSAPPRSPV